MSSTINFIKGSKTDLDEAINDISEGSLVVATDEMQWYLKDENILKPFGGQVGDKILIFNDDNTVTWRLKS